MVPYKNPAQLLSFEWSHRRKMTTVSNVTSSVEGKLFRSRAFCYSTISSRNLCPKRVIL